MVTPLRALIIEDSPDDAELVALELRRGGLVVEFQRVDSASTLREALERETFDMIVSDYVLPGFSGLAALQLVRELGLDIPFILVSGAIPDETAIAAMKAGSHDYVSKQNLSRLVAAVHRELGDAEIRRQRRRADDSLQFLADASVSFAASLEYDSTVERAARLTVPTLCDWCAMEAIEPDAHTRRTATAHVDPAKEALLRELAVRWPLSPESDRPTSEVLRTGRSLFIPEITDAQLSARAASPEHAALLRALGMSAMMVVPLVARGRTLGVLTLVLATPSRRFGPRDLALAEDFARAAALAIENARLYRDARDAALHAEASLAEAQQAIRVRDEFLSIASHELRTPLTVLKLQVQMLERPVNSGKGVDIAYLAKGLAVTRRQADRLARLIDGLLDVSRLAEGRLDLDLSEVDLAAVTREVVERYEAELARVSCSLELRADTPVIGCWDASRIEQILTNLLANALKFGAERPIEVTVEGFATSARLSVTDHGIGIDPVDIERIFGRFERAVSSHHYGGLGLGLHITRQIVEAFGGTISVESRPGKGSTFTVDLPRERPQEVGGTT